MDKHVVSYILKYLGFEEQKIGEAARHWFKLAFLHRISNVKTVSASEFCR